MVNVSPTLYAPSSIRVNVLYSGLLILVSNLVIHSPLGVSHILSLAAVRDLPMCWAYMAFILCGCVVALACTCIENAMSNSINFSTRKDGAKQWPKPTEETITGHYTR